MDKLKILVACEFSGRVRDAFTKLGHYAVSCDLLPSDTPGEHYQGDVKNIINNGWDMMIAFPPCTYLCSSGLHWNKRRPERAKLTEEALEFVSFLLNVDIPHILLENPVGCINTRIRPPNQIINPFEYGHPESKRTCLWLKNLPLLKPTNVLPLPPSGIWDNQTKSKQNKLPPSPDRWRLRSLTYQGIADAIAGQYSEFLMGLKNK